MASFGSDILHETECDVIAMHIETIENRSRMSLRNIHQK